MFKIMAGHLSISDQFAHMTAQLALELVIWLDHSFVLHCSINNIVVMIAIVVCMITSNHVDCDNSC